MVPTLLETDEHLFGYEGPSHNNDLKPLHIITIFFFLYFKNNHFKNYWEFEPLNYFITLTTLAYCYQAHVCHNYNILLFLGYSSWRA